MEEADLSTSQTSHENTQNIQGAEWDTWKRKFQMNR